MITMRKLTHGFPLFPIWVWGSAELRYDSNPLNSHFLVAREWLFQISQGVDHEPVRPRQLAKSTGCSKNFPGKSKLATGEQVCVFYWRKVFIVYWSRDGAVMRVPTFHQFGPSSNLVLCHNFLGWVPPRFWPRSECFSLCTPVFFPPQKPTFPNSNMTNLTRTQDQQENQLRLMWCTL